MTVVSSCEMKDRRVLNYRYEFSGRITISGSRTFIVTVDDPTDSHDEVLAATGIPSQMDAHPDDATALCTGRQSTQNPDSWANWMVICVYGNSNDSQGSDPTQPEPANPIFRTAIAEMSMRLVAEPVAQGYADQDFTKLHLPLTNSAGEPFNPSVTGDAHRPTFKLEQNVDASSASLAYYAGLVDNVNSDDPFNWNGEIFAARTLKIQSIGVSRQITENGYTYRRLLWEIEYKPNTWDIRVTDRGTYYLDYTQSPDPNGNYPKKAFVTEDGTPYIGMLATLAAGAKPGSPLSDLGPAADPEFITAKFYRETSFAALNLPPLP